MPRRLSTSPAPSVLSVSHALDGFLHLQPCAACFIRAALLGFHRIRSLAPTFRPVQGDHASGLPLQGFLFPRDERLVAALLSCVVSDCSRPRERSICFRPGEGSEVVRIALQSLDHERPGVSFRSEREAPAFLRFLADLHTRGFAASTQPLGYPCGLPGRHRPHPTSSRPSAPLPELHEPASLPQTRQPTALS